jgi:RNA polymerase sigma-70 factor (ECF subfamily)
MDTAFEILIGQYRPMLLCYARVLTYGDEHEAEDVVQESLLTAHRRLETFRRGEDLGRWLRGIVRNKVLESRRAARGRRAVVDSRIVAGMEEVYAIFDGPADEEQWRERLQRLLRHCIERLSQHLKETVIRVYQEGLSLREAAVALKASSAAVAQRLSRARELIRKCVQEHQEQTENQS